MTERDEPPKVLLKLCGERDMFEVRLHEWQKTFNEKGEMERFYAGFELRDKFGGSHFFDSNMVEIEDILAEEPV